MWGQMGYQGYALGGFGMFLWWGFAIWLVIFTVLVIGKLNRIVQLLERERPTERKHPE